MEIAGCVRGDGVRGGAQGGILPVKSLGPLMVKDLGQAQVVAKSLPVGQADTEGWEEWEEWEE